MKLKHYQEKVINQLKYYLNSLYEFRKKYDDALKLDPEIASDYNFPEKAWRQSTNSVIYHSTKNGLGEPLPDIYLKVPTGGGKTFLACHAIDLIQKLYLKKQTGIVLWIVPSTQIYRQTILALKDREHPYRQILDISSGGRTLIKEKTDMFSRLDVEENLMIMMLMLPSAWRQKKETLKVFKDAGGYTDFFPPEDNYPAQKELLNLVPNLDCFTDEEGIFGTQIKTSLGNTLKLLKPIVIMDEGHKAYGDLARNTIKEFNPSFLLELSATPPKESNKLVSITGKELDNEEMIKLDIHLINKSNLNWKDTILASLEKRNDLEKKANEYEGNTGEYIRPICLIQVERTSKDQRNKRFIHSEDVKEYLIRECNVPESHIAIKSSEKDDIEGIDLFAPDCDIRYIITKQALQEGWDCSFAYILTILTNPQSKTGITQLVGRILRQPFGRNTKIKELDECYVFTFRQNAKTLVKEIKSGLESEGLGDVAGRVSSDDDNANAGMFREVEAQYQPGFKKFEGKIYLPRFVIQEKDSWRNLIFEADILGNINWNEIKLDSVKDIVLNPDTKSKEQEITLGYPEEEFNELNNLGIITKKGTLEIDEAFLAYQLGDIIPNPWVAFDLGTRSIKMLKKKYSENENKKIVEDNFVFIIEELKKILSKERDRLAEKVFRKLIKDKKLCFFLVTGKGGFVLPSRIKIKSNRRLTRDDGSQIQRSLFDYVAEEDFNNFERPVALYLDEQEKLLWWYRNMSRQDYNIQGWKKNKIYPDFIAAKKEEESDEQYGTVYVLETKGIHLKNEDTDYKRDVFALCKELGAKKEWKELSNEFADHHFEFQVIFEDEWQNKINELIA